MKDFIYLNYDLLIDKIIDNYFFINDEKVIIVRNLKDTKIIDKLVLITNDLYSKGIFVNTFIINNKQEYYTKKDNEYIVLLKVNDREQDVTFNYLYNFNNINYDINQINILDKWKNEVDSFEIKMTDLNDEFKVIRKSFNYYVGMAENAIQLLNENENGNSSNICHDVFIKDYNIQKLNNPFTFINVNKMYDIVNYIKYLFYYKSIDYEELYQIIKSIDSEQDQLFFFASLLYPNYYFETISEIFDNNNEDGLNIYINNIKKYEELLSYCQKYLKKSKQVKLINWFNK